VDVVDLAVGDRFAKPAAVTAANRISGYVGNGKVAKSEGVTKFTSTP
jgi:hypothetical protein